MLVGSATQYPARNGLHSARALGSSSLWVQQCTDLHRLGREHMQFGCQRARHVADRGGNDELTLRSHRRTPRQDRRVLFTQHVGDGIQCPSWPTALNHLQVAIPRRQRSHEVSSRCPRRHKCNRCDRPVLADLRPKIQECPIFEERPFVRGPQLWRMRHRWRARPGNSNPLLRRTCTPLDEERPVEPHTMETTLRMAVSGEIDRRGRVDRHCLARQQLTVSRPSNMPLVSNKTPVIVAVPDQGSGGSHMISVVDDQVEDV